MLSSIASFLPSSLHIGQNSTQELPRPTINPDTEDEDEEEENDARDVQPQDHDDPETQRVSRGKEKEKEKTANETFIFVRPPPSKSNHPLNLQVQLVPPNGRPPTGVVPAGSGGSTATTPTSARSNTSSNDDGASLARTNSNRSSTSTSGSINYNTSTSSFASVASSNTSTRRAIIPLYNLQAHNVMTNVIVDAGTDAKIAKFQKRGIELIDLALLEPVEVWGEKDKQGEKEARRESMRLSVDEMGAIMTPTLSMNAASLNSKSGFMSARSATFNLPGRSNHINNSRPATPSAASSATSLHSHMNPQGSSSNLNNVNGTNHNRNTELDTASVSSQPVPITMPIPQPAPQQSQPKRNLFNKLFNKKSTGAGLAIKSPEYNGSPTPQVSVGQQEPIPSPSFGSFSLQPAPITRFLNINNNSEDRGRPAPPLILSPPPVSPTSPSPTSQQTTPTAPQTPKAFIEPSSPALTIAPGKEKKGHGRNISLTSAITTPFKSTLKNNRDRLSAVISAVGSSSSSSDLRGDAAKQIISRGSQANLTVPSGAPGGGGGGEVKPIDFEYKNKRDASPGRASAISKRNRNSLTLARPGDGGSRSQLSLNAAMIADHEREQQQQQSEHPQTHTVHPLALTQSQTSQAVREDLTNLKQQQLQLRPPVLGIQPTFVSSTGPTPQQIAATMTSPLVAALSPRMSAENPDNLLHGQRALMYVWLVRKWLKKRPQSSSSFLGSGNESSLFAGLGVTTSSRNNPKLGLGNASVHSQEGSTSGAAGGNGSQIYQQSGLSYGGVEVRFEWKRAKGKDSGKGSKGKRGRRGRVIASTGGDNGNGATGSDGELERSSSVRRRNRTVERDANPKERVRSEEKKRNRMSSGSFSTTTASTEEGHNGNIQPEDDGEESDAEDSETPWVCTLKIRRSVTAAGELNIRHSSNVSLPQPPPQVLRVKVATLSPTPHHPKVVAMLKVPFPLPDVEVERMGIVRRKGFPVGKQPEGSPEEEEREPYHGLTLTAEEIKDMVCSTGLWLVVREGFGGIGKVSRKGDGWRIRA